MVAEISLVMLARHGEKKGQPFAKSRIRRETEVRGSKALGLSNRRTEASLYTDRELQREGSFEE